MIATAVVSVFLHTETDQNTRKTTFFYIQIGNLFLKIGKKEDILDWERGPEYQTLVIGRKGPANG